MTALPALVSDDVLMWVSTIDLEPIIARLRTMERRWPRHVAREISLEYRRYLMLRAAHPGVELVPGCLMREFDRVFRESIDLASEPFLFLLATTTECDPSPRAIVAPLYEDLFSRPVPDTWFTEDLDRFLGSSQPGIVG